MDENPRLRKLCYLCDLPKYPSDIIPSFSEPVCRGCLNYEGSSRIEKVIQEVEQQKNPEIVILEVRNRISSISGNEFRRQYKREVCYLCGIPKTPWAIIFSYSEPVCRGCLNYEDVTKIEIVIQKTRQLKMLNTAQLKLRDTVPSTIGTSFQQLQPFNRSLTIPLLGQNYSRADNSSQALNLCTTTLVPKTVIHDDTGKTTAKSGSSGSNSIKPYERAKKTLSARSGSSTDKKGKKKSSVVSGSCSTDKNAKENISASPSIAADVDFVAPQILKRRYSSLPSPNQQQKLKYFEFPYLFCWKCNRKGIYEPIQCPKVEEHHFCFKCIKKFITENITSLSGIYCPSGKQCINPEYFPALGPTPWNLRPDVIKTILHYKPAKSKEGDHRDKMCKV